MRTFEDHPNWSKQVQLELEMRNVGIERFRRSVANAAEKGISTSTGAHRVLLSETHHLLVALIKEWQADLEAGTARRHGAAYGIVSLFDDLDTLAFIGLRTVLDMVAIKPSFAALVMEIGRTIEEEFRLRLFEDQHKLKWKTVLAKQEGRWNTRFMKQSAFAMAARMDIDLPHFNTQELVDLGVLFVEAIASLGLIERVLFAIPGGKKQNFVQATPEAVEWLETQHQHMEWLNPAWLPTVVPPKPWTDVSGGGYHTSVNRKLPFIKVRRKAHLDKLGRADLTRVYAAANRAQETAWRVNTRVLDVLERLMESQTASSVLPSVEPKPLPVKPQCLLDDPDLKRANMTPEQSAEFSEWSRNTAAAHDHNYRLKSKRIRLHRTVSLARKFRDEAEIHFPVQIDWRGRIYYVVPYLGPQAHEVGRSLIEFAKPVSISTDASISWLAGHGAAVFGAKRQSMAERRRWAEDHTDWIMNVAADPERNLWWTEAAEPWRFLAFCFEWADFKKHGPGFASRLPIQMDGSANGLQHLTALARDRGAAKSVNLIPSDRPQDLYSEVASDVSDILDQMDDPMARAWSGLVTRDLVKTPVLSLPYGSSRYGFSQAIFAKIGLMSEHPFHGNGYGAAIWLGSIVFDSVQASLGPATKIMEWLRACTSIASANGLPLEWTTSSGMVVFHNYEKVVSKEIKTVFNRKNATVKIGLDTDNLSARAQSQGVSPNLIHSLDAAHLIATVNAAQVEVGTVHDCYLVHAGHAEGLHHAIREEFVRLHERDILGEWRAELQARLPEGVVLPPVPPTGDLGIQEVLKSRYLFH